MCVFVCVEPGVMLVNPERPCLRINGVPAGWEHFTQRGWEIFEVPPSVIRGSSFSLIVIYAVINFTRCSVTEVGALSAAGWAWSARGRNTLRWEEGVAGWEWSLQGKQT